MKPRILFVVNAEWYFVSHRLSLAKALRDNGCEVAVAAGVERHQENLIKAEGFRFIRHNLKRRSLSPLDPLAGIRELCRLYAGERPDLVHHLTIKPVIYGSIAARIARLPRVINTIPGLGYMFVGSGWNGWLRREGTMLAYRLALGSRDMRVIFQNPEDCELFCARRLVRRQLTRLIRGSGVDPDEFAPGPAVEGKPVILLAARLLWDKGLAELVEATRLLRGSGLSFRTVLAGMPDAHNPSAVPLSVLNKWVLEGLVEWSGHRQDMPAVMREAAIVVLPSYREGVPRVLIEAAASGRPVVATHVPGCREVVRHEETGILVPPNDPVALAEALSRLLRDPALRARMGTRGREMVLSEFSEEVVIGQTLEVYRELLGERWA